MRHRCRLKKCISNIKEILEFIAQTAEKTIKVKAKQILRAQAQSGETDIQNKVTQFKESQEQHAPEPIQYRMRMLNESGQSVDLNNFMSRPFIVGTYSWVETQVVGTELAQIDFPSALIAKLAKKLDGVQFYAPEVEITIQLNANRMQYGRLLACVIPLPDSTATAYKHVNVATTWPKWYQVTPGTQQSVTFTVPFVHVAHKIVVNNAAAIYRKVFGVKLFVQVPLHDVSGSALPVGVTVWARFRNPNLSSYTPNEVAQSSEQIQNNGFGFLKPSEVLNTAATAIGFLSSAAQTLGMSTPVNDQPTGTMQVRQPLFVKSDEKPSTINLGPSQMCTIGKDTTMLNETQTIVQHCKHMALWHQFKILESDEAGKLMWSQWLNPIRFQNEVVDSPCPPKTIAVLPAYYYARLFRHWRGSFKLHFSFVCSSFHSLRMRLVWVPQTNTSSVTDQTRLSMGYNFILDINETKDFSVRIPFDCMTDWLMQYGDGVDNLSANGYVQLYIINPLTGGAYTEPIYLQIFASMDDDFQLASPYIRGPTVYGNPEVPPPESVERAEAQSADVLTKECALPSSSSECLLGTHFKNITGVETPLMRQNFTQCYEFTSPKQVASLLSPVKTQLSTNAIDYYGIKVHPFGSNMSAWNDSVWYNYFTQMRAIFRFGRGGIRVVAIVDKSTIQGTAYPIYGTEALSSAYVDEVSSSMFFDGSGASAMTQGFQYTLDTSLMPLDITMPYYGNAPWRVLYQSPPAGDMQPFANALQVSFSTQKTPNLRMWYYLAGADDFEFAYPTAIPLLRKTA